MGRVGVFADHVSQGRVVTQLVPLLDEVRQVSELAVLHDQVYVSRRLSTVNQGNDVGVVEALEDLDLAVEVVLELAVELREIDRLDGDEGSGGLHARG
jgi:hypothetical protein